jgi:hypothetical protein
VTDTNKFYESHNYKEIKISAVGGVQVKLGDKYARTDATGTAVFELPSGTYRPELYHAKFNFTANTPQVSVNANQVTQLDVTARIRTVTTILPTPAPTPTPTLNGSQSTVETDGKQLIGVAIELAKTKLSAAEKTRLKLAHRELKKLVKAKIKKKSLLNNILGKCKIAFDPQRNAKVRKDAAKTTLYLLRKQHL